MIEHWLLYHIHRNVCIDLLQVPAWMLSRCVWTWRFQNCLTYGWEGGGSLRIRSEAEGEELGIFIFVIFKNFLF